MVSVWLISGYHGYNWDICGEFNHTESSYSKIYAQLQNICLIQMSPCQFYYLCLNKHGRLVSTLQTVSFQHVQYFDFREKVLLNNLYRHWELAKLLFLQISNVIDYPVVVNINWLMLFVIRLTIQARCGKLIENFRQIFK